MNMTSSTGRQNEKTAFGGFFVHQHSTGRRFVDPHAENGTLSGTFFSTFGAVMEQLLASRSVSITELKRSPSTVIEQAGSEPVAVLNHNRPAAYLLPHAAYQQLLDRLHAAELREAIAASRNDPRPAIAADAVFAELDTLIDEVAAEQNRP
ncbi:prevent-host-death family protein [Pseudomonas synxantha]|uniref:Prevent-host-death family protein n=3 Tax=Pseudomonas TaxID=286 RepID=A0ACC6JPM3_9PSED|nr:prevent-host-death family protein [Pseudomonas synxantha]